MLCKLKSCPMTLLFRSFYDKTLAECYIRGGHGIGFLPLFVLAVLVALIYAVYSIFILSAFSPAVITDNITNLPEIEIRDGKIVRPENFFQRFQLADGLHLTLDTTNDGGIVRNPSPNEIYISQNGVQFVKGQKVELLSLGKFLGTENITITQDNIEEFVGKVSTDMKIVLPFFVFLIAIPVLFLKYVVLVYLLALFSYLATLLMRVSIHFEARMRLAAVSAIPVFVFNLFFWDLFGLFYLGPVFGVIVTLIYLFYYISQMPQETAAAE